jgi:aryl-alcohol dehydrogenase-like predicted oxidoreductase
VTHRALGRTGLTVGALSLGTVSLGMDYGIAAPDGSGRPSEEDAVRLVRAAVDAGIAFIDTAPAYGAAERIVGRAAGRDPRAIVATKVAADADVDASIEMSRRALDRDVIDVVQVHNATRGLIEEGAITRALVRARARGLIRVLGATVYDGEAAHAVIAAGEYGVLQVALNVLDQRMLRDVIPAAAAAGVGVVVRSAFLKGALTPKGQWLPEGLAPLRRAAERARDALAGGSWEALPRAALRYCLSVPQVATVLVGVRTLVELEAAAAAAAAGPLDEAALARAAGLAIDEDELLNPSRWPMIPGV